MTYKSSMHMPAQHGSKTNIKALWISVVLIFLYFIFEMSVALITGSLALLADALHELSTVIAIGISLYALSLATRAPTPTKTFGYLRIEIVAAFFNGLLLLGMAIFILIKGLQRAFNPIELPALPMFIVGIGGIGLEIVTLVLLYGGQKESLNIRGSFWHVINAFFGSIAIIIAAVFVLFDIFVADAWAGIVFAFVLIYASYGIIRDSTFILIDSVPKGINLTEIDKDLLKIEGVIATHHIHARIVSSNITTFSGHVIVKDTRLSEQILKKAKQLLDDKYKFTLSTIQIESEHLAETDFKKLEYKKENR